MRDQHANGQTCQTDPSTREGMMRKFYLLLVAQAFGSSGGADSYSAGSLSGRRDLVGS